MLKARCSWNVQKNNTTESAKPWPSALWAIEIEILYWDKGCFKMACYNCILKPNLRLQITLAFGLTLVSGTCSSDGELPKYAYYSNYKQMVLLREQCAWHWETSCTPRYMHRTQFIHAHPFCAFPVNSIKTRANQGTPTSLEGSNPQVMTQWQ